MKPITEISELDSLYGDAPKGALTKVVDHITPLYRSWIEASRFVILTTAGPEGTDGSPRGEDGPVVSIMDATTILLPDWRGNNRIDSLRNIVRDGRVSLMFMIPAINNVVRINGTAIVTKDDQVLSGFCKDGKLPKTVIVISVAEVYFQCAKALMRSRLWSLKTDADAIPTAGQFLQERNADFDAAGYDSNYPEYAKERMW